MRTIDEALPEHTFEPSSNIFTTACRHPSFLPGHLDRKCGAITGINPDSIDVRLSPRDANDDETCSRCGMCSNVSGKKIARIRIAGTGQFHAGQLVRITFFRLNPAVAALLVFGVPLFFALTVLFVIAAVAPRRIDSPFAVSCALGALVFGGFAIWIADRIRSPRRLPTIEIM